MDARLAYTQGMYNKVRTIMSELEEVEYDLTRPDVTPGFVPDDALRCVDDAREQLDTLMKVLQSLHLRPDTEVRKAG